MANESGRLKVLKTYKLFIGGKFPRTESGRYLVASKKSGKSQPIHVANYCQASRKDLRDAVRAARKAQSGWQNSSAYLKGQILYRIAEMLESREDTFREELRITGMTREKVAKEVAASVDRLVYFAGWSDKLSAVFSSVNPVSSPHWNTTSLEPSGVVGLICPDEPGLLGLVTMVSAAIVTGNSVVVLASENSPLVAISLGEALATSDVPAGVVNILTGLRKELVPVFASHMDVNAVVDGSGDPEVQATFAEGRASNVKRAAAWTLSESDWFKNSAEDPYRILDTVEFKTAWHPTAY
ncbi:MAG: aldehyde dehydrogenase family protein [Verrucomicrobiota bacterium]